MAVTITGSKYSGSITSVGTTTRVIDSGASFSSGDFSSPRIIGLWSSGGTYKGVAWIRQWISSTQLEIEQEFIDSSGNVVTQANGDTYLVSKNYADVATTGIAVSGKLVTLTDAIIFGTSGSSNSACFYDEDVLITSSAGSNAAMEFRGGLVVHGHLLNYANRTTSNGATLLIKGSGAGTFGGNQFKITNTSAKVWWLGGAILSEASPSRLIGHSNDGASCTPAEWQKYWGMAVNCDIISPADGAAWSSLANKQEIIGLRSAVSGTNAIALRWADGVIEGGSFRLTGSDAISLFGADAAGSFSIGAPPGQFIEVSDLGIGSKPALWRSATFVSQSISWTNVVTPNRKHGEGVNPGSSANNNATGTFYYSGTYTNLISGTLAVIKNNNLLSSVATSATVSGTSQTLTVQEAVVVGHTETVTENSWAYAFWAHGYNPVAGTFATTTVPLGPAGSAKKVQLGGVAGQVTDVNVTQTNRATVLAYSSFTNLDQVYDRAQAWKSESSANAIYPAYNTRLFDVVNGELAPATHLTIDSGAGSTFAVNTSTGVTTIKGSSLAVGSKFTTLLLAASKVLTFAQNGTIGFHIDVPATGTVKVTSETTTFTPDSVFESGATIDNTSASPATIYMNASQVANVTATSTGGGTITVAGNPVLFTGFPITNNDNGAAPNAVLGIYDTDSATWTTYDASSGSVSVSLSTLGAGPFTVRADAIGWYRTADSSIDADYSGTFDFTNLFSEILDEDGNPIVGLGNSTEMARVTYNQSDQQFELAAGAISFNSLVDKKEILTSSETGITIFSSSLVRQLLFRKNAYANVVQVPSPLTVAATASAASSPILTDCIVLRSGDPTADVFEHGLVSTASGLTDRPEVRMNLSKVISNSGVLEQLADLSDLRGYTEGVTVTIDTTNGTIATSNGKRVRVSTSGLTRTIERDDP